MTQRVATALAKLKSGTSFDEFIKAVRALVKFANNVVAAPEDPKFRKIKVGHPPFQKAIGSLPGGIEALEALGFAKESKGDEEYLVMETVSPELVTVCKWLDEALASANSANANNTPAPVPAPAPVFAPRPTAFPPPTQPLSSQAAPSWQNMMGGFGAPAAAPPAFAGMGGLGMGAGMGGMPGLEGMTPEMLNQMMADPQVRQLADQFSRDPQMLQQVAQMLGIDLNTLQGGGLPPIMGGGGFGGLGIGGGGLGAGGLPGAGFGSQLGSQGFGAPQGFAPPRPEPSNNPISAPQNQTSTATTGASPAFGMTFNGEVDDEFALQEAIRLSLEEAEAELRGHRDQPTDQQNQDAQKDNK
eukprot:c18746_g1_i3.p1 GENE.c18746_g1_i3~~c18746_g1_i3.p1  ORF type:complete len:357 (+),score=71.78 c18746_g1_i3:826-1896(+)